MKDTETTIPQGIDQLTLVDLDDLRQAFGGEGSVITPNTDVAPPRTCMCPGW